MGSEQIGGIPNAHELEPQVSRLESLLRYFGVLDTESAELSPEYLKNYPGFVDSTAEERFANLWIDDDAKFEEGIRDLADQSSREDLKVELLMLGFDENFIDSLLNALYWVEEKEVLS